MADQPKSFPEISLSDLIKGIKSIRDQKRLDLLQLESALSALEPETDKQINETRVTPTVKTDSLAGSQIPPKKRRKPPKPYKRQVFGPFGGVRKITAQERVNVAKTLGTGSLGKTTEQVTRQCIGKTTLSRIRGTIAGMEHDRYITRVDKLGYTTKGRRTFRFKLTVKGQRSLEHVRGLGWKVPNQAKTPIAPIDTYKPGPGTYSDRTMILLRNGQHLKPSDIDRILKIKTSSGSVARCDLRKRGILGLDSDGKYFLSQGN